MLQRRLLAVYGTLKKGYYNYNAYLKGFEPIFEGFVKIKYKLYSNGRYPMIIKSKDLSNIFVEVYIVEENLFTQIKALEEPFGYHYTSIQILEINESVNIFVYSKSLPPNEFLFVPDGNWKATIPWDTV